MNRKELIQELMVDHMDDCVYAVFTDSDGEKRVFSIDGIALKQDSVKFGRFTFAPTIELSEVNANEL